MRTLAAFAAAAALAAAAPAGAAESAADFQLYVLGDLKLDGQHVGGRVAAGGDASFSSTSIAGATAALPASLVVGGDLTYHNGGSIAGQALVGGTANAFPYMPVADGQASLPVDFDVENLRLKNLSSALAGQAATGTAELKWGGLFLSGSNSDLNVFTITSAMLSQATWFSADIAQGSQVLINVVGDDVVMGGGLAFHEAQNVLWNFAGASAITAGGVSVGGSILAPFATFTGGGGSIAGSLIVGDFTGAMSFGNAGYSGDFLAARSFAGVAIPEPGVWTMMILGFGAVGAVLRRRRAGLPAAA